MRHSRTLHSAKNSGAPVAVPARVLETLHDQEALLPMPRSVEGLVDDPSIHNPLQRSERLSTGWFGVVLEWDGVLVQDTWEAHVQVRG